jgi:hypothetical protein
LLENRLGHQRNAVALIRVNERGAPHLVTIGDSAIAVVPLSTRRPMNLGGGKIARALKGSEGVACHKHPLFQRFAALEGTKDVFA